VAKTITVVIGDLHAGGSTAIATPEYTIHTGRKDETTVQRANKAQDWLFSCWLDFWDYVKVLAGIRGKSRQHRLITVFLGEFVDNIHHASIQCIHEIGDQENLALEIMRPVADMSDGGFFVTPGTEAHAGAAGGIDFGLADQLGAAVCDWQLALDIDGIVMDFAHHGVASASDWTSSAARIASTVILDYAMRGQKLPRYIFRGHRHVIDDSGEKLPTTRAICTPSWQLRTAFGYKVSSMKRRADIGGIIVDGDRIDFSRARYSAPISERRIIKV
jgi:hypothetical protein